MSRRGANAPLVGILCLAVVARIAVAVYLGNSLNELPGVADQLSYHTLALRVLDGHGFSFGAGWWPATAANEPTAHWSFLYTLFLSAIYGIVGPVPLVARLIQAVLVGVFQPLLTFWITRRLFGRQTAVVAAVLVAGYSYFVYYAGTLVTEAFFFVALLWIVDRAMRLAAMGDDDKSADLRSWILLGLALGTAALLRQTALLLAPVVLGWVAIQRWREDKRFGTAGRFRLGLGMSAALLVLAMSVLPWTIRNYIAFREVVLLNTNAGFAFFWGNHPIHGTRFVPILPSETYGALIPDEVRGLNEAQMDRALMRRGLGFVAENPTRYVRLSFSRATEYLRFWPSEDSRALANYVRALSFGVCLPLIAVGVVLALTEETRRIRNAASGIWLLVALAGVHSFVHLVTWTLIRYRLPVEAVLMPFAALAVTSVGRQIADAVRRPGHTPDGRTEPRLETFLRPVFLLDSRRLQQPVSPSSSGSDQPGDSR